MNLGQRRALDSDLEVGPVNLGSVSRTGDQKPN